MPAKAEKQSIEQLKERFQKLNERKIVAETERKHALEKLAELKAVALEKFGSNDPEELEKKLKKLRADNEKKRSKYQSQLDEIETRLNEINDQFDAEESD